MSCNSQRGLHSTEASGKISVVSLRLESLGEGTEEEGMPEQECF